MLLRNPGSTLIATLALTLAIGANSAIFSVVDGVLLRPLPYADADRLIALRESNQSKGMRDFDVTPPDFRDWSEQQHSFDQIAAFRSQPAILTGRGLPERIETAVVSPAIFPLLGVRLRLGRAFAGDEDRPGRNRVAILSYGLWQRRFGGDTGITGDVLTLDGKDYVVVGVAAPGFRLAETPAEIWLPYTIDESELQEPGQNNVAAAPRSAMHTLNVIGRLKPGVSIEQARLGLDAIAGRLEQQFPDTNAGWRVDVQRLRERLVGNVRGTLLTLLGAVGFVLLIACTNVANLLLARAGGREKEIAVRTFLGARQSSIIRQLLTESMMLALLSGVLGLILAYAGVRALAALSPADLPRRDDISIDWRVLVFTLGVAMLTGILFGLAPAITAARTRLNDVLKAAGRSSMASLRSRRLRSVLVVAEVALSVVLLTGAALMIRSFAKLQEVDPGFRPDHVLTLRLTLPEARYRGQSVAAFYQRLVDKVRELPGVRTAAVARDLPLSGTDPSLNFIIEHRPALSTSDQPRAKFRAISAGYFAAMGIPLLKGRSFSASDAEHAPSVAIVNDVLARRFFPDEDPLGKRIQTGFDGAPWSTIVGVIARIKHAGLDAATNAEMYYPYQQVPAPLMNFIEGTMTLVVRTSGDPSTMARAIAAQVQALDPEEAVFHVATMDELLRGSMAQPRFRALMLGVFALVALILAVTGLYGVISYSVSQRTNELGIRAALGAQKSDLLKLVLAEGTRLAALGVGIGLILSLALARTIAKLLYGVNAHDLLTFIAIPVGLLAIALFASYMPARRAARVDPIVALRYE